LAETPGIEPPPLTKWTLKQGSLLEDEVCGPVYVGMRNWHPYIADTVAQMRADGVTHFKAICLAPQNSRTSVGLYRKAVLDAAQSIEVDFVAGWSTNPTLAHAFADRLWPAWAEACAVIGHRVPVLFTAHSVPCRTIMSAPAPSGDIQSYGNQTAPDPYPVECKNTARAIAQALRPVGMTEKDWCFAFQSQGVAGAPWIGPSVEDTLKALAAQGHKGVVLQPVGFLCDHVEILYDIDIAFKETARELGMQLWRAESLNGSPLLIRALEQVATGRFAADVDEKSVPALVTA
jgi:ferrochelatase